jgi:hypothetical protein
MTEWEFRELVRAIITRLDHLEDRTDRLEMYQADIRENVARSSGAPKKEGFTFQWPIGIAFSLYILWLLDREFVKVLAGFVTR